MKITMRFLVIAAFFILDPSVLHAADFEIFDGQTYNGKFYPRIDVIEWSDAPGQPTYMDFHIYSKAKPIDLSFQIEATTKKKVMLVNYFIAARDAHQCRRVLAPGHFAEGYFVYKDSSDADYDSVIVSMQKMPDKKGRVLVSNPPKYLACAVPDAERSVANAPSADPAQGAQVKGAPPNDQVKSKGDKSAIKPKGAAVPFDF